ncbi:hypothetical protein AB0P44_46385, partial [Streptomyces chartreusis]|uniref:hypothetical protein n=1 Tax=Streptomyces chartreusis TaxID=1969 RepID=UPI00341FBD67
GSLGRKPIYQGLHHVVSPTAKLLQQVGKSSMSLFHSVVVGEVGWSVGVVARQGPSSLAW